MRAAPIWPCHRRALRHPVPRAPERAFVVTRARDGKHFLRLPSSFHRGVRARVLTVARGAPAARSAHARAPYKVCHFGPRDIGASGFRGFTVFIVSLGLSFLKRVFLPGVHIHMLRGIHTLALGAPGCGVAAWHMQWRLERCGCELHPASKLAGPREGSRARRSRNAVQQAAQTGEQ